MTSFMGHMSGRTDITDPFFKCIGCDLKADTGNSALLESLGTGEYFLTKTTGFQL